MREAAAYIRVSTDMQTELSPDAQRREVLAYAKLHDMHVDPAYIYVESGASGTAADKRPVFQHMIATAKVKPKPFDVILVWKFSRFARNQEESAFYKSILRKKCGVDVVSVTEPIIEGMYGRLIEMIIEWSDEFYSYNLAQEVHRGMTENALRGGYQATAPIGYRSGGKGEVPVVVPERAAIVQQIFEEFLAGYDRTGIARRLNEAGHRTDKGNSFENRTIDYILRNPFYIGKIRWNNSKHGTRIKNRAEEVIVADGKHEAIVTREVFEEVQRRLTLSVRPVKARSSSTTKHWLSGMLVCSRCGHTLAYSGTQKCPFFQCHEYAKGKCDISHSLTVKKAERLVIAELRDILKTGDLAYAYMPEESQKGERRKIEEQLARVAQREKRAKEAYLAGIDTLEEYKAYKGTLKGERDRLADAMSKLNSSSKKDAKPILLERIAYACDVLESDSFSHEQKGSVIRSVLKKIVFDRPNETLHFYFYFS